MSECGRDLVDGAFYPVRQNGRVGLLRWNEHAGVFDVDLYSVGVEEQAEIGPRVDPAALFGAPFVIDVSPAELGAVDLVGGTITYTPPKGDGCTDSFSYTVHAGEKAKPG